MTHDCSDKQIHVQRKQRIITSLKLCIEHHSCDIHVSLQHLAASYMERSAVIEVVMLPTLATSTQA